MSPTIYKRNMKKKQPKKKETKQVVEIHIYVHTAPSYIIPNGSGTYPNPITNPPYIVTC